MVVEVPTICLLLIGLCLSMLVFTVAGSLFLAHVLSH